MPETQVSMTKKKKAQLMCRMVNGYQLPEPEARFWAAKPGTVCPSKIPTGFSSSVVVEPQNINK